MFTSLLNYYLKNAQDRINERIEVINKKRSALRSSGSSLYSDLKSIERKVENNEMEAYDLEKLYRELDDFLYIINRF